jgi:hypothetical protein
VRLADRNRYEWTTAGANDNADDDSNAADLQAFVGDAKTALDETASGNSHAATASRNPSDESTAEIEEPSGENGDADGKSHASQKSSSGLRISAPPPFNSSTATTSADTDGDGVSNEQGNRDRGDDDNGSDETSVTADGCVGKPRAQRNPLSTSTHQLHTTTTTTTTTITTTTTTTTTTITTAAATTTTTATTTASVQCHSLPRSLTTSSNHHTDITTDISPSSTALMTMLF